MRSRRLVGSVITWAALAAVAFAVASSLKFFGTVPTGPFRMWILVGAALLVAVPLLLLSQLFPPPVDANAHCKKIDYEFNKSGYAFIFRKLNAQGGADE